jgi:hydroxymethylbilane synthase
MNALRIGTRGSALAMWQARTVASLLEARGVATEIVTYKTSGDRLQERPLTEVGTKGLFVKELEDALLAGAIDLAVHSAKDMSVKLPEGLAVSAVLPREDPRDALVLPGAPEGLDLAAVNARLAGTPSIGTSSVRRAAQLRTLWPEARFEAVRGNVDTRLRKVDGGEFDAIVLAAAGLKRLGFAPRISLSLGFAECIPAPCQGIVAIETREGDVPEAIRAINDAAADAAFRAERTVVTALGGGCQLPLGAIAVHASGGTLEMQAIVVSPDGARRVRGERSGDASRPEELGQKLAAHLARNGAVAILDEVR